MSLDVTTDLEIIGRCPLCGAAGAVGTACVTAVCRRLGTHLVPADRCPPPGEAPDPMVGQVFDAFLVIGRLGAGGVGSVYLAEHRAVGLPVALKVLHAADSPLATSARFRGEAMALARLNHPNIVRLVGFGQRGERVWLAMEHVAGARTLADALRDAPTPAWAPTVLRQVIHALAAAHAAGVVHRDIKPANIMLQAVQGEPHLVRLVDFGLAKFVEEGDATRLAAGTPRYMAPEQALKRDIGPWTDWYAVGVLACEMLFGRTPFDGDGARAVLLQKCDPAFDPVAALGPGLPAEAAAFVRGALAVDPAERFADGAAMQGALDGAWAALERGRPADGARGGGRSSRRTLLAVGVLAAMAMAGRWWAGGRSERAVAGPPPTPVAAAAAGATPLPDAGAPDRGPPSSAPPDAAPPDAAPPDAAPPDAAPPGAAPGAHPAVEPGPAAPRRSAPPLRRAAPPAAPVAEPPAAGAEPESGLQRYGREWWGE